MFVATETDYRTYCGAVNFTELFSGGTHLQNRFLEST